MKFNTFLLAILCISNLNAQDLPVSDRPINNAESTFRFAIVSDRTGGMRGGIFAGAIDKVEMLQPEFVLSVGDLIDGYTEDPEVWNAQWDEFDAIIEKLSMPFYYVAGNHDTSNEILTEVWRERHGRDYYHFVYKDVLFLALNTDEIQGGGIGEAQVSYFKKVLEENQDVRWTLLFMHRPVWSYGDRMGYDGIEEALGNRKYTLFSGHHHHYRYKLQNGMEHFTLATTGGGSWMRNPDVGELDHITWVTMKDEGPEAAHIDINGIYGKYLVPEEDYDDIQILRRGNWLEVQPYINESSSFQELPVTLSITNNSDRKLTLKGTFGDQQNLQFEPGLLETTLASGESREIKLDAKSKTGPVSIADLNNSPLVFEMNAGFEREERNDISLVTSKRLFLDWKHILSKNTQPIIVDGELLDWEGTEWTDVRNPQYFREGWDWKGERDGRFEFAVAHDFENLYLAVRFYDERMIVSKGEAKPRQDKFYLHIDGDIEREDFSTLEFALGEAIISPHIISENFDLDKIDAAITENGGNQILEVSIPLSAIKGIEKGESVRLNVGVMDHDRPENTKPSILWWRPVWNTSQNYAGSGMFSLEK